VRNGDFWAFWAGILKFRVRKNLFKRGEVLKKIWGLVPGDKKFLFPNPTNPSLGRKTPQYFWPQIKEISRGLKNSLGRKNLTLFIICGPLKGGGPPKNFFHPRVFLAGEPFFWRF